jgi:uncharacterized protein
MNRRSILLCALLAMVALPGFASSKDASISVLAFYSANVERDHVEFAEQALQFFSEMAKKNHFQFASTSNWGDLNTARLEHVDVVLWLNDSPHTGQQRTAFEQYMERGGGWLGFHAAAYNDSDTRWPWFVSFLGGAVFYGNSWPPLPATLRVDDKASPVTRRLPPHIESPANEWYSWLPSPRANEDIKVLLTLDVSNYPLGFKDTLTSGDIPVVWTNTKYRMIYMNMGHGDKIFTDAHQNDLFEDALRWLGGRR